MKGTTYLLSLLGTSICVSNKTARTSKRSSSNGLTCLASSSVLPSALLFYCDGVLVDTENDGHWISFREAIKSCFSQADKFLCLMDATATNYLKLRDAGAYVEALEGYYKTVNKQMNSIHRMIQLTSPMFFLVASSQGVPSRSIGMKGALFMNNG
ncbi:hypothetical protein NC652_029814 [Populus alba x Populus x berolinensis]|nr:hypothetical protein NC652_029814 [Populus alba x Populus x berolinensis]